MPVEHSYPRNMMVWNFLLLFFHAHIFGNTEKMEHNLEQEAYGVYYTITKWNYYLQGADIIARNDHKLLNRFLNGKNANNKVNRWGLELATYNITFEWISGAHNKAADCLSLSSGITSGHTSTGSTCYLSQTQMDPPLTPEAKLTNASPRYCPPHSQILHQKFQK